MRRALLIGLLAGSAAPVGALAQTQPAPASAPTPSPAPSQAEPADDEAADDATGPDIVVTGSRAQPGAVVGDIPPEQQLGPADIRSYGVSTLSDLLTELAPETRSDRGSGGAPVVLLNGRRIGSFAEIRDVPTEAIQRVDILPEEVALKYGYRADQRVVNVVLRRRFRATTVELADRLATEGGRNSQDAQLDLLHIRRDERFNLHLHYQASDRLLESQRDILPQSSLASIAGNVTGIDGGEIDPALSAAAGSTVTVAGVPASAAVNAPDLTAFVGTAGAPTFTDPGRFRTLLPGTSDFTANLTYARPVSAHVLATLNANVEAQNSTSLQGLPGVTLTLPAGNPFSPFANDVSVVRALDGFDPLTQRSTTITSHAGVTLNGDAGPWRWTSALTYDRINAETFTDTGVDASSLQAALNADSATVNPFAPIAAGDLVRGNPVNLGSSVSSAAEFESVASGPLFTLPAGKVNTSIRFGAQTNDFTSRSLRANIVQTGDVRRDIGNGQINLDVPIAKPGAFLGAIGQLSLNTNLAVDHLSDFGTLTTFGYGANWSPIRQLRFIASVTHQDDAPTAVQLGNPVIVTPGVRTFDFVTGRTVTITQVTGGNPGLVADNRHVFKLGLTAKPLDKTDLTITANYITTKTSDPIASFPGATAAIEAAFPDRFTRDSDGNLLRIDSRPVNFDRTETSELRYGFDLSLPLKSKLQKQFEAYRNGTGPNPLAGLRGAFGGGRGPGGNGGQPGGGRGFGGGGRGGRGGFGGRGQAGGRLQFALYHTWHFRDTVLVRQGGPFLDLLNGDTLGGAGQPRHELEGQAGYVNNGLGARLSANWRSGTTVRGGSLATPDTLNFSSLGTFDLRLFADFSQRLDIVRKHPWVRGARVTFAITNLLNSRQRVTDAAGVTPISYQPDYLDPLGRTVRLSFRKLFY